MNMKELIKDKDRCELCGKHFISHEPSEIICSCNENYCHGVLTEKELSELKIVKSVRNYIK